MLKLTTAEVTTKFINLWKKVQPIMESLPNKDIDRAVVTQLLKRTKKGSVEHNIAIYVSEHLMYVPFDTFRQTFHRLVDKFIELYCVNGRRFVIFLPNGQSCKSDAYFTSMLVSYLSEKKQLHLILGYLVRTQTQVGMYRMYQETYSHDEFLRQERPLFVVADDAAYSGSQVDSYANLIDQAYHNYEDRTPWSQGFESAIPWPKSIPMSRRSDDAYRNFGKMIPSPVHDFVPLIPYFNTHYIPHEKIAHILPRLPYVMAKSVWDIVPPESDPQYSLYEEIIEDGAEWGENAGVLLYFQHKIPDMLSIPVFLLDLGILEHTMVGMSVISWCGLHEQNCRANPEYKKVNCQVFGTEYWSDPESDSDSDLDSESEDDD